MLAPEPSAPQQARRQLQMPRAKYPAQSIQGARPALPSQEGKDGPPLLCHGHSQDRASNSGDTRANNQQFCVPVYHRTALGDKGGSLRAAYVPTHRE